MSGGDTGTKGGYSGTSGEGRFWPVYSCLMAFLGVFIAINITSKLIEVPPGPHTYAVWEPFLWELSSLAVLALLCPACFWAYRRWPLQRLGTGWFLAAHLGIGIVFSLLHIALMVAIRWAGYALVHKPYDFANGNLPLALVYEGRKDLLTYAIFIGAFWLADRLAARQVAPAPRQPQRIEIKADGRTLYLAPGEIVWIEAAGNYVEVHVAARAQPILVRGTLGEYEGKLAEDGFVRVHRSRLLNRAHIKGFETTHSGDVTITLSDGRDIAGSRRFRDNLQ